VHFPSQKHKNDISNKNNSCVVKKVLNKSYGTENRHDEFLDKVGVLGYGVFFDMFNRFPFDYNYRETFGIEVKFTDAEGHERSVRFTPSELESVSASKEPEVFEVLAQQFRAKYENVAKTTPILAPPKSEVGATEAEKISK
jgi:hypothetical protein